MSTNFGGLPNFRPKNYLGKWYQIASYPVAYTKPSSFGIQAQYSSLSNGNIKVVNTNYVDNEVTGAIERESIEAYGVYYGDGIFEIVFSGIETGVPNYYVIWINADYSIAVVSEPNLSSLYILSRSSVLSAIQINGITTTLKAGGFDVSRLIYTYQFE